MIFYNSNNFRLKNKEIGDGTVGESHYMYIFNDYDIYVWNRFYFERGVSSNVLWAQYIYHFSSKLCHKGKETPKRKAKKFMKE